MTLEHVLFTAVEKGYGVSFRPKSETHMRVEFNKVIKGTNYNVGVNIPKSDFKSYTAVSLSNALEELERRLNASIVVPGVQTKFKQPSPRILSRLLPPNDSNGQSGTKDIHR